jgi:hypothetical protein
MAHDREATSPIPLVIEDTDIRYSTMVGANVMLYWLGRLTIRGSS